MIDPVLRKIAEALRDRYGERLQEILFFGSRVRGDASPESDYDCLLVFDRVDFSLKEDLNHLSTEWLLEEGILFSWIALSKSDLDRLRYEPFLQNARREGVSV